MDTQLMLLLAQHGAGPFLGDWVLTINRVVLGLFFAISGFHKLFNVERHATLVTTLENCHVPFIRFNQWWVPSVEFFGGLALLSGVLAPLAALALAFECMIACCTDGIRRIPEYKPIDKADWLDDLLYLPESLYIVALLIVAILGPGPFTVPALLP